MAHESQSLLLLQQALRHLPGVGPRNAQRMAFYLLERNRNGAQEILDALQVALETVAHCERCNNLSDSDVCGICASPRRNPRMLCVVEGPADLKSIEQSGIYDGLYFVLMGHISPIDGIGPEQIGIDRLLTRLNDDDIDELVLGTNLTTEGEATAALIADLLKDRPIRLTRLARGLPVGGELEYADQRTLARAFEDRREFN